MPGQRGPHPLAIEVDVERQRAQRGAVRALEVLAHPGVAVRQSPGRDRQRTRHREHDVEIVAGMTLDRGIARGVVAADLHVVHVELGDQELVTEIGDAAQELREFLAIQRLVAFEMRLQAEIIDRHVAIAQPPQQREQVLPPAPAVRCRVLDAEVVDAQRHLGISRPCQLAGEFDMLAAKQAIPDGAAIAVLQPFLRLDRLVDHVPGPDLAAIAADQSADVALERGARILGAVEMHHPIGIGGIPDERVPVHDHVVARRIVGDAVGGGEIEFTRARLGGEPFQVRFRDEEVGLRRELFQHDRIVIADRRTSRAAIADPGCLRPAAQRRQQLQLEIAARLRRSRLNRAQLRCRQRGAGEPGERRPARHGFFCTCIAHGIGHGTPSRNRVVTVQMLRRQRAHHRPWPRPFNARSRPRPRLAHVKVNVGRVH